MLDDESIGQLLHRHESLPEAGAALIDAANDAGGKDNIAVILARVRRRATARAVLVAVSALGAWGVGKTPGT